MHFTGPKYYLHIEPKKRKGGPWKKGKGGAGGEYTPGGWISSGMQSSIDEKIRKMADDRVQAVRQDLENRVAEMYES